MISVDEPLGNHLQAGLESGFCAFLGIQIVRRIDSTLPFEPQLARKRGVKIGFDLETHAAGKGLSAGSNEQMMVSLVHHRLGNERRRSNTLQRRNTAGPLLRSV